MIQLLQESVDRSKQVEHLLSKGDELEQDEYLVLLGELRALRIFVATVSTGLPSSFSADMEVLKMLRRRALLRFDPRRAPVDDELYYRSLSHNLGVLIGRSELFEVARLKEDQEN